MTSPPRPERPRTDEEVRQYHRDARRRAIISALQSGVTAERAIRQTVTELRDIGRSRVSDQENDSLRLALADMGDAMRLAERARVLITGSGAIS